MTEPWDTEHSGVCLGTPYTAEERRAHREIARERVQRDSGAFAQYQETEGGEIAVCHASLPYDPPPSEWDELLPVAPPLEGIVHRRKRDR